jgi:hypothetical protein
MTALAPLLRDSDFQAAWYYSAVIFAGIVLIGYAAWLVFAHLRVMWRKGDRGMAAALAGATTLALLMFTSLLVTAAVALWPATNQPGGG